MVKYTYDSWGNCKVTNGAGTETNIPAIGELNPIRYRGYYYDVETKLYYLKSRYYDPSTGRFLSMDDTAYLDPETINGLNLYAYCGNNPVMRIDPDGTKWWEFWKWNWKAIGTVLAITVAVLIGVAVTVFSSGLLGAVVAGAVFGFAAGTAGNLVSQVAVKGWDNVNYGEAFLSGAIGAGIGAIGGAFSFGFSGLVQGIGQNVGFALSKMVIGGLKVSKVFSTATLMAVVGVIGKMSGSIFGAALGEFMGNKLFGKEYYLSEDLDDTIGGQIFGWLVDFGKWLKKIA